MEELNVKIQIYSDELSPSELKDFFDTQSPSTFTFELKKETLEGRFSMSEFLIIAAKHLAAKALAKIIIELYSYYYDKMNKKRGKKPKLEIKTIGEMSIEISKSQGKEILEATVEACAKAGIEMLHFFS
jgi:hypothetical protein